MTDDIQAKLRAQAEKISCVTGSGTPVKWLVEEVHAALTAAYALGVSSERARQQGLIQQWREQAKLPEDFQPYAASAYNLCADELESTR